MIEPRAYLVEPYAKGEADPMPFVTDDDAELEWWSDKAEITGLYTIESAKILLAKAAGAEVPA